LLGLDGVAVKAHGSSDARAIRNALAVACELAASEVVAQVGRGIEATVELSVENEPRGNRGFWRSLRGRLRRDGRLEDGAVSARVEATPAETPAPRAVITPPPAAPATAPTIEEMPIPASELERGRGEK
jgi:hypothetical protein